MNIPLEWLKQYVNINKPAKEIAQSFTAIGLLLDKPMENNVLDLEHRGDRADWLSITGCARDLAAYESLPFIPPKLYTKKGKKPSPDQLVPITVKCPDIINRFNTRVFRGVVVKESPKWLKNRLEAYGIAPKNNIVDITNYVMVELGQPLHAQDLDKFERQELTIRRARAGESITTLLGEKVNLNEEAFVLAQNDKPVVIGGIVGGKTTAVDTETRDILLDAGNYDQAQVRRTSRHLKIQNETVMRYDKFLHPMLTEIALQRATQLILDLAGGTYYDNVDWYPENVPLKQMKLTLQRIAAVSGLNLNVAKTKRILVALGYRVIKQGKDYLDLEIPYFRTDIQVEDDLVADVLRINDYQNIPSSPIELPPPPEITPELFNFETKVKNVLIALGIDEHITNPIVAQRDKDDQVKLQNSYSSDQTALRTSIKETLSNVVKTYRKHAKNEVKVFEIGKTYHVSGDPSKITNFEELNKLGVIYHNSHLSVYNNSLKTKQVLSGLLHALELPLLSHKKEGEKTYLYYGQKKLGTLSHDHFELDTLALSQLPSTKNRVISTYRNLRTEDISFLIDQNFSFGPVFQEIARFHPSLLKVEVLEEHLGKGLEKGKKSILVRLTFKEKADVTAVKYNLLKQLKSRHGITTRSD